MSGLLNDLRAEYRTRLARIDLRDKEAVDWTWLWLQRQLYAYDHSPGIFALCQQGPKAEGLKNIFRYVREEITERELYDLLYSDTAVAYVRTLCEAGVLDADCTDVERFKVLAKEVVLEGVKAFRPLRGVQWDPRRDECPVAHAAATIWLRYVELVHAMLERPSVHDLIDVMIPGSAPELEILVSDDFAEYELTDREREDLERDLGLPISRLVR